VRLARIGYDREMSKSITKRLRNKKARAELKRTTEVTTLSGARVHNTNYGGGLSKGDLDGPAHSPVRKSKSRKPFYLEAKQVKSYSWRPNDDSVGKWKKWFGRYKTRKSGEQGLASAQKSWWNKYYEFRLREEGVEVDDDTQRPETEQKE